MTKEMSDIMEAARLWMIRANAPDFDDWGGLTDWLEDDPRHLGAYEAALEEDEWTRSLVAAAGSGPSASSAQAAATGAARRRPWLALGGAIAAVLVAVGAWSIVGGMPDATRIETSPGERRTIALADGTQVALNGDSSISYDRDAPRTITVNRGEAVFDVRHDEARLFVV